MNRRTIQGRKLSIGKNLTMLALFLHNSQWGEQIRGDERGFVEKAIQFKKAGIEVHAIEMAPSLQEQMGVRAYHSILIPRFPRLRGPFGDDRADRGTALLRFPLILIPLIISVVRAASKIKYDFIYLHNQDFEDIISGFVLQLLSRKKVILVYHMFDIREKEALWHGLKRRLSQRFNPMTVLFTIFILSLKGFAIRKTDLIIAVSHSVKDDLERYRHQFGVPVTGNGVDIEKFRPIRRRKLYDAVFLGRLHPQKGIDILLKAWKIVISRIPTAKLAIIGSENAPYPQQFKALSHDLRLDGTVEFRGFVADNEIAPIVSASKLFVLPTRYDGFANTIIEALACGIPGVISDIPALRENHSEVCLLVQPNDVEALAAEIVRLISDDTLRERLGRRARKHASKFRWEDVVSIESRSIRSTISD